MQSIALFAETPPSNKIKMFKLEKIYPRDIIAVIVIICGFIALAFGADGFVTAILTFVIGYYFSKRMYEERNPNGDLKEQVKKIESKLKYQSSPSQIPQAPSYSSGPTPPVVVKPPILAH